MHPLENMTITHMVEKKNDKISRVKARKEEYRHWVEKAWF